MADFKCHSDMDLTMIAIAKRTHRGQENSLATVELLSWEARTAHSL